ncbi:MAG: DUF4197 domain-containing protein [Cytophagales bacterium]|nr:DUF4197 domain-containing protein [Cytophagales bacterium]
MNKLVKMSLLGLCLTTLMACEEVGKLLEETTGGQLSEAEVVAGLKEALSKGTDTSSSVLGRANGYFKDEAVKILLPAEADPDPEQPEQIETIWSGGKHHLGSDRNTHQPNRGEHEPSRRGVSRIG